MTYPLATLAPTISSAGISIPTYYDVWQSLLATYREIFGSDAYLDPDSKDGQWIAALAQVIHDNNQAAVAVFNSFSPTYAYGAGLASRIKINGLTLQSASYSTAVGTVTGVANETITGGRVRDSSGVIWALPASVTIGAGGTASVTVTCETIGAIPAAIGDISEIYNPQYGWQSFTNTAAAVLGSPVESDAEVRLRQKRSTALPSQTVLDGIYAGLGNLANVSRVQVYENATNSTDINGIPEYSISAVVEGGDSSEIATVIQVKKTPGAGTYGSSSVTVYDARGLAETINYFPLTSVPIYIIVTVKALAGFSGSTPDKIKAALVSMVSNMTIGEDLYYTQAIAAASLPGTTEGSTFYIPDFKLGTAPSPTGSTNVTIAFNAAATLDIANVSVVIT